MANILRTMHKNAMFTRLDVYESKHMPCKKIGGFFVNEIADGTDIELINLKGTTNYNDERTCDVLGSFIADETDAHLDYYDDSLEIFIKPEDTDNKYYHVLAFYFNG